MQAKGRGFIIQNFCGRPLWMVPCACLHERLISTCLRGQLRHLDPGEGVVYQGENLDVQIQVASLQNGLVATCVLCLKRERASLLLMHDTVGTFPSIPFHIALSSARIPEDSYDILFPLNDKFPWTGTYTNTRYPYFYCGPSMVHRALKRCKVAAVQLSQRVKFFCPSDFGFPISCAGFLIMDW